MPLAGESVIAGKTPSERIATSVRTANSSAFTAETVVQSVTAALVSGRTYRVRYAGTLQSTVAADSARSRIREDDLVSAQRQIYRVDTPTANAGYDADMETEYTAGSTGNKTFVVTGDRAGGTGNISSAASASQPCYLYVDYIRG